MKRLVTMKRFIAVLLCLFIVAPLVLKPVNIKARQNTNNYFGSFISRAENDLTNRSIATFNINQNIVLDNEIFILSPYLNATNENVILIDLNEEFYVIINRLKNEVNLFNRFTSKIILLESSIPATTLAMQTNAIEYFQLLNCTKIILRYDSIDATYNAFNLLYNSEVYMLVPYIYMATCSNERIALFEYGNYQSVVKGYYLGFFQGFDLVYPLFEPHIGFFIKIGAFAAKYVVPVVKTFFISFGAGVGEGVGSEIVNVVQRSNVSAWSNNVNWGTVSGAGTFNFGTWVNLQAHPNPEYNVRFIGWFDENGKRVSTRMIFSFQIWGVSRNFEARFQNDNLGNQPQNNRITINATVYPYSAGRTVGSGTYIYGSYIEVLAIPNRNYRFVEWINERNEVVSTDARWHFYATQNKTIRARFVYIVTPVPTPAPSPQPAIPQVNVTAIVYPVNSGMVIGCGSFDINSTISLWSIPHTHWAFDGFFDPISGHRINANQSWTFIITEHTLIQARFVPVLPIIPLPTPQPTPTPTPTPILQPIYIQLPVAEPRDILSIHEIAPLATGQVRLEIITGVGDRAGETQHVWVHHSGDRFSQATRVSVNEHYFVWHVSFTPTPWHQTVSVYANRFYITIGAFAQNYTLTHAASHRPVVLLPATILPSNPNEFEERGNTSANIANLGNATLAGNYIYFINNNGRISRMRVDGTNIQHINDERSFSLNVVGEWIYYVNIHSNSRIYRIQRDGTNRQRLNDVASRNLIIIDNWIYFINLEQLGIFRMALNGRYLQRINTTPVQSFYIADGWIYYELWGSNRNGVFRVRLDGTDSHRLNNANALWINIVGDWIYFSNNDNNGLIYRIHMDGSRKQRINNDRASRLNIFNGWIYYINESNGGRLYRIRIDGTGRQMISSNRAREFNIAGEWIFYSTWNSNGGAVLYRIRIDGSERLRIS